MLTFFMTRDLTIYTIFLMLANFDLDFGVKAIPALAITVYHVIMIYKNLKKRKDDNKLN